MEIDPEVPRDLDMEDLEGNELNERAIEDAAGKFDPRHMEQSGRLEIGYPTADHRNRMPLNNARIEKNHDMEDLEEQIASLCRDLGIGKCCGCLLATISFPFSFFPCPFFIFPRPP